MASTTDDWKDYRRRIEGFTRELNANRTKNVKLIALDGLALLKRRVINNGVRADGRKFSDYSRGYARVRQERGRPVTFKNFSFTNDMWNSIQPIVEKETKTSTIIAYDSTTAFGRDKLRWNSDRENISLVAIAPDEQQLIDDANNDRINALLDKWNLT